MTFFALLAQDNTPQQTTTAIARLFSRLDALAHPDALIRNLEQLHIVLAGVFVAAGLVCMLQGFKLYKGVVLAIAMITGVSLGYTLGQQIKAELIVAGCLGVLLAVVAWPLMKYAVAVAGGIAGSFVGANTWTAMANQSTRFTEMPLSPDAYWAGALMGLILFGLLSFILFELSVVLFTTFSGSVLATIGIIALLLHVPAWNAGVSNALRANPLVVPMLVIVPAVIGLVVQQQIGGFQRLKTAQAAPKPKQS